MKSARRRPPSHNPLEWLNERFYRYLDERRRAPREDVLTGLALAKYEDGSTPDLADVVNLSTFLFAAGSETTTKLVSSAVRFIADNPGSEQALREDRSKIPAFLEETLRMESPVKAHFRMARTTTTIGDVTVPAGHNGDAAAGRLQSGRRQVRAAARVPRRPARMCASTSRSSAVCTPARVRRWPGPRDEFR